MEELNQVQQVTNDGEMVIETETENLFDGWEDTDSTPTEESEQSNTETTEPQQEEVVPFLKIKYNGEEQGLNEEEARTLAQKGMNYDRFYEPIERLARLNGLSVGDYLNRLNDTQIQYEISKEVDNLKADPKYENVSDEILEEIANSRVMENIGNQETEYQNQQREIADAQDARVQRDLEKFMEEYPEFRTKTPDSLDPKVFEYIKQGYTLLEAYNKWSKQQVNPQTQAKQKNSKLNEENKKKSLGNTTNAGNADIDDFMNGFLNG